MIAHVQRLLLGRHHVRRRRDAGVTVLTICRASHVRRIVKCDIGVVLVLQFDSCVRSCYGAFLLEAAGLAASCADVFVRHALHAVCVHLLHAERVVVASMTTARSRVLSSAHELFRTIFTDNDVLLAARSAGLL